MRRDDESPTSRPPIASSPATSEDAPACKAICRGIPFEKKNAFQRTSEGLVAERIQSQLFPVQTGTLAKNGFFVCLLPQAVVVLSKIIEWVQVLQRAVQRVGAPVDGFQDDRPSHFEQQYLGGLFDDCEHRGQRMEQVQEIFRQSGHVPFCLHNVRQSLD